MDKGRLERELRRTSKLRSASPLKDEHGLLVFDISPKHKYTAFGGKDSAQIKPKGNAIERLRSA